MIAQTPLTTQEIAEAAMGRILAEAIRRLQDCTPESGTDGLMEWMLHTCDVQAMAIELFPAE